MKFLACAFLAIALFFTASSCGLKGDPKPPTKEGGAQTFYKPV
ncbi:MAG: hypothetical protein V3S46_07645 [Nitrospinota bacterium]